MLKRVIIGMLLILFTAGLTSVQAASISSGINWLIANQNADSSWGNTSSSTTQFSATAEALEALRLNGNTGASFQNGFNWLNAQHLDSTNYASTRTLIKARSALNIADDLNFLIALRNSTDTLWGLDSDHVNSILDTASALQALKSANCTDQATINSALAYLTGNQNPDGGWGFSSGTDSNVYITAIVSATLQQFPQMTTIANAVSKATSYLLALQNADGGFGSSSTVYETALAYIALVGNGAGAQQAAPLQNAVNYLIATQSANGSWNDDPYSTALALKALYLSENRPSPPPPPPAGGKITGTVIDKFTSQQLGNVSVTLESNQLINATTDALGNFTLNDIPAGSQKVNISLAGYAPTAAIATVVVDSTANIGTLQLVSSYSTGFIAGTIADSTGKPLAGVAITVTGAWSGNTTTGADGTYSFTYVSPGAVTINAAKAGYQTVTAPGAVYARTTLTFSPRMSTTPSQLTTGALVGRVVDSHWGVPIDHLPEEKGVEVTLSGGLTVPVEAYNGGYFSIPNLAPGTYQVIVGMHGFAHHTFRVVITPGGVTDLGTIRLQMSFLMTLTGKITDASTGAPIPEAEVSFTGKDFTSRADSNGMYAIADIPTQEEFTVRASATGYVGKSYIMRSSPWLQTMDFALSPLVTKGSLTGIVIDAATGLPLAGVSLTLANDPTVNTTTDSSGKFTLNEVLQGIQKINITLGGYSSRTLTTVITAGAVNNVGVIPLSVTPLAASIQGRVWDAVANAPFPGVAVQTAGTGSLQTVTAADGTYLLTDVPPGTVTVATGTTPKPGYAGARFTSILEPGGLLVFSPALSTTLPGTVGLVVQTDKEVYGLGDTVRIAIAIKNREATAIDSMLHVRVTDSSGAAAYETSVNVNLDADGAIDQPLSFVVPVSAQWGGYTTVAEVFNASGKMLANAYKSFGVTVSQIAITPTLPASFSAGDNTLSFTLANTGTLAVSAGNLVATLKDPDGQVVSTISQSFSLGLDQTTTITGTMTIPPLKFGAYTLSYTESDETKTGAPTDILLPNTLAITALFDDNSHRIRQAATLSLTLRNTGRFNLDSGTTSQAAVPDAAYTETKMLTPLPAAGNAIGSTLLYNFAIPETIIPGQHGTRITVTLPSGSTTVQSAQLAIMESSLALSPIQTTYTVGDTIHPVITNSGGVDTPVQYRLSLYDSKSALIAESGNTETVLAGSTLSLGLSIPTGAVDGSYNLVVNFKDLKTGKEGMVPNAVTISGVKGSLQVQTNKENYLLTENITGSGSMTSNGTPLTGGNLHLQVTTGAGMQKSKTWTTQADFQTGVRSGVDTYGVNDWIIPDDDFSGTSIDVNKWTPSANITLQSGRVFADSTVNTSGLWSKWQLEGDFDIQVDYDANSSTNNQGPQLVIMGTNFFAAVHNNIWTGDSGDIRVDGSQFYNDNKTYRNSGKLRITRAANTITTYYWSGSAWSEINHATSANLNTPCGVSLYVWRWTGYATGASAYFDNFKVNSGRIKTVNQTLDSVRLLPLNDNFDDGVFNQDRWMMVAGISPVESSGALQLLGNAASPTTTIQLRPNLAGDFSAFTSYKNFNVLPSGRGCKKVCVNGHYGVNQSALRSSHDQEQRPKRRNRHPTEKLQDP